MKHTDENTCIKRILNGETELFAYFLDRYSRPLYSLIIQIVSSPEDTEELLQDVFLKAFQSLGSYRGGSSFSTWLYRIAYNKAISATRKQKNECFYIEESVINNVSDDEAEHIMILSDNEEQLLKLSHAIGLLNADEKALITLFYYEEKSIEEVALIFAWTQVNVKVKLHRIRKKLYVLMNGR
ncbi:RNA polymerase sigma factor [Bacteroides sp. 51]|uniref:RNA polymerase sigma factor n=1 Tax=Bacteroides sp. 51 TaxID=2302938 RepID=UPI0013D67DED|nr:RNA polymerase sigma factor [Bacteroides sp. 51]NDV82760.1 RNA polymerase sigma factor [Bacteroides sp. 51]